MPLRNDKKGMGKKKQKQKKKEKKKGMGGGPLTAFLKKFLLFQVKVASSVCLDLGAYRMESVI